MIVVAWSAACAPVAGSRPIRTSASVVIKCHVSRRDTLICTTEPPLRTPGSGLAPDRRDSRRIIRRWLGGGKANSWEIYRLPWGTRRRAADGSALHDHERAQAGNLLGE